MKTLFSLFARRLLRIPIVQQAARFVYRQVYYLPNTENLSKPNYEMPTLENSVLSILENSIRPCTVIIPVFNGGELVKLSIQSAMENLRQGDELLIIDDGTTCSDTLKILNDVQHPSVNVHRNPSNIGFTKTVNKGISLSNKDHDVLILNSDAVLPAKALRKLQTIAYSGQRVATVTPVSNKAGAFSDTSRQFSPEVKIGSSDEFFKELYSKQKQTQLRVLESPTGNGYCLFVKRNALDSCGLLDEVAFPRGYGEENDLCQRFVSFGYVNLVTNVPYVYHKGTNSFDNEEKKSLELSGMEVLRGRYPLFEAQVRDFIATFDEKIITEPDQFSNDASRTILIFDSIGNGGVGRITEELVGRASEDSRLKPLVARTNLDSWTVVDPENPAESLMSVGGSAIFHFNVESSGNLAFLDFVIKSIVTLDLEAVHFQHLSRVDTRVSSILEFFGVISTAYIHDFFPICPSQHLIESSGKYCGGNCEVGFGQCSTSLLSNGTYPRLRGEGVHEWRGDKFNFLQRINFVAAPSKFSKNFLEKYAQLQSSELSIEVVSPSPDIVGTHDIKFSLPSEKKKKLRILIPGNLGKHKGSSKIASLYRTLRSEGADFEFVFAGVIENELFGKGKNLGPYKYSTAVQVFKESNCSVGLIASSVDETYCLTFDEMVQAGIPVVVWTGGAPLERAQSLFPSLAIGTDAKESDVISSLRFGAAMEIQVKKTEDISGFRSSGYDSFVNKWLS